MRIFQLNPRATVMTTAAILLIAGGPALLASEVDNRIESATKESYNFKTYLKDDSIKIDAKNGVVTLTGTVAMDFHKSLAEETVSGMPGVRSVINQLQIAGEQPTDHSDGWVSMKVMTALTFHKHVSATGTTVHTQNGVVTLTGIADNEAQKQLTTEYAKDVEGVTEVRNDMTVANPTKPANATLGEKIDDSSITAQVRTTLLFHKSTHVLATKVHTKDGVVSVSGEAKNEAEKELVSKLAEDVKGVKHVRNHMIVKKS
jgi:hyperosmotically inducible periplasmic protein